MRRRLPLQIGIFLLVAFACLSATGQSNQEWMAIKSKCGLSSGLAYNDWVASGSPCNAGSTAAPAAAAPAGLNPALGNAAQSAGYALGQELGKAIFGDPAAAAAAQQRNLAAQRSALAAEQLNNSGLYLLKKNDYAGAVNEFQQALNQAPNDANILFNLQLARQRQKNAADAAKTSNALGNLLGTAQGTSDKAPGGTPNPLNLVNLDPNVVDFRGMGHTSSANPNSSLLNTVITGSDSNTVDLGKANKNYVDPKLLENQINSVLGNPVPTPAQISPQEQIDKLFHPPQSAQSSGISPPQPPSDSRINASGKEQQTKTKVNVILSNPAPSPAGPHN